ncbi:MAG: enoyl-CoA hydratase-related protein [Aminobacterium sp.]|nr:enoyl-CoA hydratase-related protein [Aminobacterium sp.]
MSYKEITIEKWEDRVGRITLNRPENLNTFNSQMACELDKALLELDEDKDIRVIIVKGAGRVFCDGIDLKEFPEQNPLEYREWVERMEKSFVTISKMKKPVIAQVHGVAAANGLGLIAAADLAVASEDARMGLTAINVGLHCVGPVIAVSKSVGRKKALEMVLYGNLIHAQEALSLGLINKVVPFDRLEDETRSWASELAQKSPLAIQMAKQGFYTLQDMEYEKQFAYANEVFARLCTTEDALEGISAFFEKRSPHWKER